MSGHKVGVLLIVAMVLTASIGYFMNASEEEVHKTTFNKVTEMEGIIGENAGTVSSYDEYNPIQNITGWYGNTTIPLMGTDNNGNPLVSPYILSPRGVKYTYTNYEIDMSTFTHVTGEINASGTIPTQTTVWETSTDGVGYASYPVTGNASENSETTWVQYTDGSAVHGGYSGNHYDYTLGAGGIRRQYDTLTFNVNDEQSTVASPIYFASVGEVFDKLNLTLKDGNTVSIDGNWLYNCKLYAEKTVTEERNDANQILWLSTSSKVYLQGSSNPSSNLTYRNGVYIGTDTEGKEWTSANVYIYTVKSKMTLSVGIPSQVNPTYANPYEFTTINNSGYDFTPSTTNYTFDWSSTPLTIAQVHSSQIVLNKDNMIYPTSFVSDGTGGQLKVTYSDSSEEEWPQEFIYSVANGKQGLKNATVTYTNADDESRSVYVYPKIKTSTQTGYVFYQFTGDLFSKYIPTPAEGDIIEYDSSQSVNVTPYVEGGEGYIESSANYSVAVVTGQVANIGSYSVNSSADINLSDVYFMYTNGFWVMYNKATDEPYAYNAVSKTLKETVNGGWMPHTSIDYYGIGNALVFKVAESNINNFTLKLTYYPTQVVWSTTDSDVVFSDYDTFKLSNGEDLMGGHKTGSISYTIGEYDYVSLSYMHRVGNQTTQVVDLRWIGVDDLIRYMVGERVLRTATDITFTNPNAVTFYKSLEVEYTANPSGVYYNQYITVSGVEVQFDRLEYGEDGLWVAYSGLSEVWTGKLSELTLLSTSTNSIPVTITTEGYAWADTPSSDKYVGWWSNGIDNPTIVNGKVSFLLIPSKSIYTQIQIYTGDILKIYATPNGTTSFDFTYSFNEATTTYIGLYKGLHLTYSILDDTFKITGLTNVVNPVSYSLSPVELSGSLENTDSLKNLYFLAVDSDWGSYVTSTEIANDPFGQLWGGFDVDLSNYLSEYLPGLRVTINGVVRYGDAITINNERYEVNEGKIEINTKSYELSGSAIDYDENGHTYLKVNDTNSTRIDLGNTLSYNIIGEGSWYFSSIAYTISDETTMEYQWKYGWDLDLTQCVVVFMVLMLLGILIFLRLDIELSIIDWAVLIFAIVICMVLIGSSGMS